jgi:holo-[acyl-carrier protein] synthase
VIIGVGIDVVDVARFVATLARAPRLVLRLFTAEERELPPASLAARFAAKEACAKALGAPAGLRWLDASVSRGPAREPSLRISGTVLARAQILGVDRFHLSMSHDAGIASAIVIAERGD